MKNLFLVLTTLIFIVSCTTTDVVEAPEANYSPVIVDESKSISLFNGKDLTGWKVTGTEKWYVENGLLVCENGPDDTFGYLSTIEHYKNFQLTLEYKQEKRGNSGVFIHTKINGDKVNGWQVEIAPPGHHAGGINKYQRGWLAKPNTKKDEVIKMGEWNKMKIIVNEGQLTSWLNGTLMATIDDVGVVKSEGGIALQIHGENETHIKWRNIQLVEL